MAEYWQKNIDRIFRYLEMIIISSLIGVIFSSISENFSLIIKCALSLLAGMYISIPISKWFVERILPTNGDGGNKDIAVQFLFAILLSIQTILLTTGLSALLTETVQINKGEAKLKYELATAKLELSYCPGGFYAPLPESKVRECIEKQQSIIRDLETRLKRSALATQFPGNNTN